MIQPPKMSPVGLASAGIGTTRSAGSQSLGNCTDSTGAAISMSRVELVVIRAMRLQHLRALQLERRREQAVVHGPWRTGNRHAPDLRIAGKLLDLRVDPLEHQLLRLRQLGGQR